MLRETRSPRRSQPAQRDVVPPDRICAPVRPGHAGLVRRFEIATGSNRDRDADQRQRVVFDHEDDHAVGERVSVALSRRRLELQRIEGQARAGELGIVCADVVAVTPPSAAIAMTTTKTGAREGSSVHVYRGSSGTFPHHRGALEQAAEWPRPCLDSPEAPGQPSAPSVPGSCLTCSSSSLGQHRHVSAALADAPGHPARQAAGRSSAAPSCR